LIRLQSVTVKLLKRTPLLCGIVVMELITLLLMVTPDVSAAAARQVVGVKQNEASGYIGVSSFASTPNPSISTGWSAAPVGLSNFVDRFIETGPIKNCAESGCPLRPYFSWQNGTNSGYMPDTLDLLGGGVTYHYYSNRVSGTTWQGVWCYGGGCVQLISVNLSVSVLPKTGIGGETSSTSNSFGSATFSSNQFNRGSDGSVSNWFCYDDVVGYGAPVPPHPYPNITITGCTNNAFSVQY
jgi:hypothetical protein